MNTKSVSDLSWKIYYVTIYFMTCTKVYAHMFFFLMSIYLILHIIHKNQKNCVLCLHCIEMKRLIHVILNLFVSVVNLYLFLTISQRIVWDFMIQLNFDSWMIAIFTVTFYCTIVLPEIVRDRLSTGNILPWNV